MGPTFYVTGGGGVTGVMMASATVSEHVHDAVQTRIKPYTVFDGRSHRRMLQNDDEFSIVATQREGRGLKSECVHVE